MEEKICQRCKEKISPTEVVLKFYVKREDGDYHAVCALKDSVNAIEPENDLFGWKPKKYDNGNLEKN